MHFFKVQRTKIEEDEVKTYRTESEKAKALCKHYTINSERKKKKRRI